MHTSVIMMLIGIFTVGVVQAADKKTDHSPGQIVHGASAKHKPTHNKTHHSPNHNASGKQWTPPPGRLPDSLVANLTFGSDYKKHQEQLPVRFNQVAQVPEPGSLVLVGIGLIGIVAMHRRRK